MAFPKYHGLAKPCVCKLPMVKVTNDCENSKLKYNNNNNNKSFEKEP